MSGAYTFSHVFSRLHPRYLFEESRGQLIDAFWGSQDLGEPNVDPFTGSVYVAHPTTGAKIVPDIHKRHPWDTSAADGERGSYWWGFFGGARGGYEEVTGGSNKVEAERSAHGELAYKHFTKALHSINQLEPGKVGRGLRVAADTEKGRLDLGSAEPSATAETALAFNRYLLHRYRGVPTKVGATPAESTFSNAAGLKQSYRTIRAGTYNLLARNIPPWRGDITFTNTLLSVAFLAYALYFQARGCALIYREAAPWWSFSAPPRPSHSSEEAREASARLFFLFLLKEAYPITYYLFWIIAFSAISLFSLALFLLSLLLLGPALFLLDMALGPGTRSYNVTGLRRFARALRRDPLQAFLHRSLAQQVQVWSLMGLNLSSLYRIKEQVLMLTCRRLSKPSIRDNDNKLASVSNLLFNLGLLVLAPDDNSYNVAIAAIISLIVLFYQMVCEKQRATDLAEALRDLNENRLSKFELGLLLVKLIDDVTLEETQFNFLEHFYSNPEHHHRYRLDHVPCEDYLPGDPPALRLSTRLTPGRTEDGGEEEEEGSWIGGDNWV